MAARTAADGKWVGRIARTAGDGVGAREWLEMGGEKKPLEISELGCADGCGKWVRRIARTAADGLGAREWLEMGGEKKPLEIMSLAARTAAGNGCGELRGRLRTAWVQGSGWKWVGIALVMSELGCADGCGQQMGAEKHADGCGRRGCKQGVAGIGSGEEAAGDERAWLRGQLRTGNGFGELRGRLRTAWVQRSCWKWVRKRSRW